MHPQHHGHGRHPHLVPLRFIPPGGRAVIVGYAPTHQSYRSKLLSMGLTKGTAIIVRNVAPLGDPVHISVRDFELSLRADEADALLLQPLDEGGEARGAGTGRRFRSRRRRRARRHHEGQPHEGWPEHMRHQVDRRMKHRVDEQMSGGEESSE